MKKSTTGPTWVATFLKVLTFFVSCIYWPQASHACSVHDHGCIFHAFGSTVSTSNAVTTGPSTLHIYAIGTTPTTGTPSTVDFDNKVLLPGLTSNLFDRVYYQPTGPYIVNSTSYGAANPPPDWNPGGNDGARQVYPSQYKVTFNANTAQARHTGDLNGGENGLIPGATGCPNMPGAANCEAVVVTGNVPSGIYEQRVRIFNYYGIPNPQVDIQAGAYVTGSGVLVSGTHIPTQGGKEIAYFTTLTGTGAISDTYKYEFYDRGFDPHAAGVAWFDRSRNYMKTSAVTTGDHRVTSTYRNTLTTRTTIRGNGQFDQHSWTTSKLVGRTVEEIVRPKQTPQMPFAAVLGQQPFVISNSTEFSALTAQGSLLTQKTTLQLPKLYAGEICTVEPKDNAIISAWKPYQFVVNGQIVTYTQADLDRFAAYQRYGVVSIPIQDRISGCTDAGGNSIACGLSFGLEAMARNAPIPQSIGRAPTSYSPKQVQKPYTPQTKQAINLDIGKQGKHIIGHNNYQEGRSVLTHQSPQDLVDRYAGKGEQLGRINIGMPGSKERVDFEVQIGIFKDLSNGNELPTTMGIIHYAADGVHIVPARPHN